MTGLSAFKCAGEIPVRSAADIGVLRTGSPLLREPMLVTDAGRLMTEVWRWTPAFLRDTVGTTCLQATLPGPDGKFRYEPGRVLDSHPLPVAQFFDDLARADGPRWCVQQISIERDLPSLARELDHPCCVPSELINAVNLWLASPGTVTPLHYDDTHNLFAQVSGAKTFYLFPPESLDALYPGPLNTGAQHLSRVDLFHPDLVKHPLAASLSYREVTVQAGEALVLPAFWWHQVVSHDEVSTSVNFWWRAHVMDCLCPGLMRQLRSTAARDNLRALARTFEFGPGEDGDPVQDAAELARLLSDIGEYRAAAGLSLSILHTLQLQQVASAQAAELLAKFSGLGEPGSLSVQEAGQVAQLVENLIAITSGKEPIW
jgi:hypothetical protein